MQKGVTHATREPPMARVDAPRDFNFAAGAVSEAGYYDILPAHMRRKPIYVCRLSVTNTPYLGIDLTDEGKKTNAVGIAEARYGYRPKNTAASYQWEFISPRHGVIASQDDEKGTARPAEPSDSYEGDTVVCHATLTETNPPEGHTPCTASATVEHPITVVKVDVVIGNIEENEEESEGAFIPYADYGDNEVQARYAESIGVDSLYRVCDDWANPGCQSKIMRGPMKDCSK